MSKVIGISLLFVVSQFGEIFTMFLLFSGEFIFLYFICTGGFSVLFKSSSNFIFASSSEYAVNFEQIFNLNCFHSG